MKIDNQNFIIGLNRVSSIILANHNYNEILGSRLQKDNLIDIDYISNKDEKVFKAVNFIVERIVKRGFKKYKILNSANCICYVKTRNNANELNLFDEIVKISTPEFTNLNLANVDTEKYEIPKHDLRVIVEQIKVIFYEYYQKENFNSSVVYQHYQYLCSYMDFYVSLHTSHRFQIHFTANDHSPILVALTMNCIRINLYTIYSQHASVSESFPPLIFNLSILHNIKSAETYKIANEAKSTSQVNFILSRNLIVSPKETISRLNLIKNQENNIVVIYLTAIFNDKILFELINYLTSRDYVTEVYVKFHPSTKESLISFLKEKIEFKLCEEVPNFNHIAIVGNSSVLLELISKGVPSLNYFQLDNIKEDYYEFVEYGISRSFSILQDIKSIVKSMLYDDCFQKSVNKFIPSFEEGYNHEYIIIRKKISLYINAAIATNSNSVLNSFINLQLEQILFSYTGFLRNIFEDDILKMSLTSFNSIIYLQKIFDLRDQRLINLFSSVELGLSNNLIYTWLQLYKIEWTGARPVGSDIDALFKNIFNLDKRINKQAYKILENKLLSVLLRYKDYLNIKRFLELANYVTISNLHINRRIALLKLVNSSEIDLGIDADVLYSGLSSFHVLKMNVQGVPQNKDFLFTHLYLENKFIEHANLKIAYEFKSYIIPVYNDFRSKMQYMDVSHNIQEKTLLKKMIIKKIINKTPFSFIRLSDGEGYIFSQIESYMSSEDVLNRERHWWGIELDAITRTNLQSELISSLSNVDLLGIPTMYRFIRDSVDKSTTFLSYLQGRGMYNVILGLKKIFDTRELPILGSDKINLALLPEKEDFIELMDAAEHIVFITSVKEHILKELFDSKYKIDYIELPTHFKTKSNDLYNSNSKPLPLVYKDINKEISLKVQKGSLVFVAGGIVGKIFISKCKNQGAIAIDTGSAIDLLIDAGIHSLH